jgi:hypothetical protein
VPATTTGARFVLNGPTLVTLASRLITPNTAAGVITTNANAYNLPATSTPASPFAVGNLAVIEGFIRPLFAGNLVARFASEIGGNAVTVQAGANVEWTRVG